MARQGAQRRRVVGLPCPGQPKGKASARLGAHHARGLARETLTADRRGGGVTARAQEEAAGGGAPRLLAPAGFGLGVALFLLSRAAGGGVASLADFAADSVPLDAALANGRPSIVEFYADWCSVCKSVAQDSAKIKDRYGEKVNFVMLNVDNPKWAEEMSEYRVDGIPHWEYLDSRGEAKGFVVGNLPKEVLDANASALSRAEDLPYVREIRAASRVGEGGAQESSTAMPRDHG